MKAAVVIPVYKKDLNNDEKLSLNQCFNVLGKHPLIFVAPKKLDLYVYKKICLEHKAELIVKWFNDRYFESINSYNKLMLLPEFYKKFILFDYILIYQLDSYVFRDKLKFWCNKGFDFIGAPWVESGSEFEENSNFMRYAGNGGFSLRKVKTIIKVLETRFKYVEGFNDLIKDFRSNKKIISILTMMFRKIRIRNMSYFFIKNFYLNEDRFFVFFAKKILSEFSAAPNEEAMLFSFECQPKRLYKLTGESLPFGCHGWRKYDDKFWSSFIDIPDQQD